MNDTSGGYQSWAGAATTIQAAVNVCSIGDIVWVSNGTYKSGATVYSGVTNRVYINKAITVRSWGDNRTLTRIEGEEKCRPVYMAVGSSLIGFTITNGDITAGHGGGICCASANVIISNCLIAGNMCPNKAGGGVYKGTLYNCDVIDNISSNGGGVYDGVLNGCNVIGNYAYAYGGGVNRCYVYDSTIISNKAESGGGGGYGASLTFMTNCIIKENKVSGTGGGVSDYNLYNCELTGNNATNNAGGANGGVLYNCLVASNNAASEGGGVRNSDLFNAIVIFNQAGTKGGGCCYSGAKIINNCLVAGNRAETEGGGVYGATWVNIYNTTISGNSASNYGGICYVSSIYNSISWNNHSDAGAEDGSYTAYYSCGSNFTGNGCISEDPKYVDAGIDYGTNHVFGNYRLKPGSPCINSGTNEPAMAEKVDLDGRARQDRFSRLVDMGCYEYVPAGNLWILK